MCCILRAYAFGTYRRMHCWWTCKSSGCDMLCLRSNSGIWNFRIHWRSNLGRMSCLHSWRTYYKVPYQGITIGCLIGAIAGGLMGAMSSGDCSSVVCSAIAGCASGMVGAVIKGKPEKVATAAGGAGVITFCACLGTSVYFDLYGSGYLKDVCQCVFRGPWRFSGF